MALLQISEPGAAPDPHARRHAVGIDLGTTNSLVAAVRNGVAECLPDRDGEVILPSAVRYLPGGGTLVGAPALAGAADDPHNTVVSAKRLLGRGLADLEPMQRRAYDFVDGPGMVQLCTAAGVKSPVEVSAEILATLRQRAEDTFDADLFGAVITVPAYFDDAQRQATKDAARLARIDVLRLISEPTAAAIAYGLDNAAEGLYAVYDLGGGTFDISLLRLHQGRVRGRRDRRRLGPRRRRHRCRARGMGAARGRRGGGVAARSPRGRDRRARCQGGADDAGRGDARLLRRRHPDRAKRRQGRPRAHRQAVRRSDPGRGPPRPARRPRHARGDRRRRPRRRFDADADRAPCRCRAVRPRAAGQPRSRPGGGPRRGASRPTRSLATSAPATCSCST